MPEQDDVSRRRPPTRGRGNSLFYFQQDGSRSYLRLTPLGAVVLVLIIVVPVIALLILFYVNTRSPDTRSPEPQVNTNITVLPAAPSSANTPVIRQVPPPSPAKAVKQPSIPPPPTVATPGSNTNQRSTPKQTPQPLPSESPP